MNGKTTIDSTLNPCSAEMDRKTYGWRWLCVSFFGNRVIWFHIGRLTIDIYWSGGKTFWIYGGGANRFEKYFEVFFPFGSVTWVSRKVKPMINPNGLPTDKRLG